MRQLTLIVVIVLAACGGKKAEGPTCEQVTDHILEVTKQQLPGHENTNLTGQRKAMIDSCEKKQLTTEVRTCLMGAKTISEIAKCRGRGKSNVFERPRRPRRGSGTVGSGRPVKTGSGSAGSAVGSAAAGGTGSGSGSAR